MLAISNDLDWGDNDDDTDAGGETNSGNRDLPERIIDSTRSRVDLIEERLLHKEPVPCSSVHITPVDVVSATAGCQRALLLLDGAVLVCSGYLLPAS